MRNNDSVICLSYRLWNTTKHLSVNIKSCHAVIDIRFNPSRANSSDNDNFVSFPLKSRNGVLVALQNAYYFQHILPLLATCLQGEIYFRSSLHPKSVREATKGNTSAFAGYLATGGAKFGV